MIRTDSTWGLEATLRTLPTTLPPTPAPPDLLPTAAPPVLTMALAPAGRASSCSSAAASVAACNRVAAWNLNGLRAPDLATKIPSRRLGSVPDAASETSRYALANRARWQKLRQPQRNPEGDGTGASGLAGSPAGGSGMLKAAGATSLGASPWYREAKYWICPRP